MKIGIFARRERGEPTTPEGWDHRFLSTLTTRVAFAVIETIDDFAPRWSQWATRLSIEDPTTITVLGDGAEWIWNAASRQFGDCHQVLDIYHAAEHIDTAAKGLFGEGEMAKIWLDEGRQRLLSDGWVGLCDHLGQTLAADNRVVGHAALDDLTNDFAAHTERLNYCHRLYTVQSIGGRMAEGAAKNLIGRRLKRTGARWNVENANATAQPCCLTCANHWDPFWASPN